MTDIQNLRVLADVASESGAYEDLYKYTSKILEQDTNDAKSWIEKGIAAAFLTDTAGSKIGEARVLIKRGVLLGVDQQIKRKIINKLREAYNIYCSRLNDELLGKIKDYQKVAMPHGGSAIIHGLGQQVNKNLTAKGQGVARVKGLDLIVLRCEVMPTPVMYSQASIALVNAKNHSKQFGNYLNGSEDYCIKFRDIESSIGSKFKEKFPVDAAKTSSEIAAAKKEGCFIATAATGSYDHPKVMTLRKYRDNILLSSRSGRFFVACYYTVSPFIAVLVARSEVLKRIVMNCIVNPAVKRIDKSFFN